MQYNVPPKTLLTTPDGRQFIYFRNTKVTLWIEVINFLSKSEAMQYIFSATNAFNAENKQCRTADFQFGKTSWCVLILLEDQNHTNQTGEQYENTLSNRIKRLASWYLYTYLVPNVNPT